MSTPAQFYDQNGELRIDGTLVAVRGARTVTLDAAAISTMETAYYDLLPSVGALKLIVPLVLAAVTLPGTIPYDFGSDSQSVALETFTLGSYGFLVDLDTVLGIAQPSVATTLFVLDSTIDPTTFEVGNSIRLIGDAGHAPSAGNGRLRVTVEYVVVDCS